MNVITSGEMKHAALVVLAVLFGLGFVLAMIDKARGKPVREFPAYASLVVASMLFAYLLTSHGGA